MQNYDYIQTVGEGAYGEVWQCRQVDGDKITGRVVAVKGFKAAHEDKDIMRLAMREAKMLEAVSHENVVRLITAFKSKSGRVYMVFDYAGSSVQSVMERAGGGLGGAATKLLSWQLLQAAAHLHGNKVLHRDIKPANILVDSSGVAKLCDFGFARAVRCGPREAQRCTSYVVTRWYRAPEVLVSDEYGAASDIWSVGCSIAEFAVGRALFPGSSTADQLWRIMRCFGPLPSGLSMRMATDPRLRSLCAPQPLSRNLRQRLPEVEPRLLELVAACLRLDPAARPTAAELLQMPYFCIVDSPAAASLAGAAKGCSGGGAAVVAGAGRLFGGTANSSLHAAVPQSLHSGMRPQRRPSSLRHMDSGGGLYTTTEVSWDEVGTPVGAPMLRADPGALLPHVRPPHGAPYQVPPPGCQSTVNSTTGSSSFLLPLYNGELQADMEAAATGGGGGVPSFTSTVHNGGSSRASGRLPSAAMVMASGGGTAAQPITPAAHPPHQQLKAAAASAASSVAGVTQEQQAYAQQQQQQQPLIGRSFSSTLGQAVSSRAMSRLRAAATAASGGVAGLSSSGQLGSSMPRTPPQQQQPTRGPKDIPVQRTCRSVQQSQPLPAWGVEQATMAVAGASAGGGGGSGRFAAGGYAAAVSGRTGLRQDPSATMLLPVPASAATAAVPGVDVGGSDRGSSSIVIPTVSTTITAEGLPRAMSSGGQSRCSLPTIVPAPAANASGSGTLPAVSPAVASGAAALRQLLTSGDSLRDTEEEASQSVSQQVVLLPPPRPMSAATARVVPYGGPTVGVAAPAVPVHHVASGVPSDGAVSSGTAAATSAAYYSGGGRAAALLCAQADQRQQLQPRQQPGKSERSSGGGLSRIVRAFKSAIKGKK
eukprot:XP_001690260.1 predicted protein [Chlamydomonas reinhardtii]